MDVFTVLFKLSIFSPSFSSLSPSETPVFIVGVILSPSDPMCLDSSVSSFLRSCISCCSADAIIIKRILYSL